VKLVEGRKMTEYENFNVPVGVNPYVCDNNLLATSWGHQQLVVEKLKPVRNLDINSGFDDRIFLKNPEKYWRLYSQLDLECYSEDTEILTENGFKLFSQLNRTERVATLNIKTGYLEYQHPTKYYSHPYKGHMTHFKGRSYDLLVTPNHQMLVRPYHQDWQLREASQVTKTSEFKRDMKWEGQSQDTFTIDDKTYPMELWLEFLGWWITEGSATIGRHKNGVTSGYQVTIHQIKHLDEVRLLVQRMGFTPGPQRDRVTFNHKGLCIFLRSLGRQEIRYIPAMFKKLPPQQLHIMFESLIKGDGSTVGSRHFYYTCSHQLADDVAEIALKLGYCVTVGITPPRISKKKTGEIIRSKQDKYQLSISKQNATPLLERGQIESVPYSGTTYCVDVPNHTLLVRRNGKTVWSGNCWRFAYDLPEQKEAIKACADFLHGKGVDYRRIIVFCIAGFGGTTFEECRARLQYLVDIGVSPYPMRYRPITEIEQNTIPAGWYKGQMDMLFGYYGVPFVWRSCTWNEYCQNEKSATWRRQIEQHKNAKAASSRNLLKRKTNMAPLSGLP
jgi:hypothetical protein